MEMNAITAAILTFLCVEKDDAAVPNFSAVWPSKKAAKKGIVRKITRKIKARKKEIVTVIHMTKTVMLAT